MGITSRLAEFVRHTSFQDLPPELVVRCKDMMLNAAAAGLAGAAQPEAQALTRFVEEMRGNGRCTLFGMGVRTSPVYASLVNGLMVHLLDFDDEVMGYGNHPSSCVFPVVVSLGEMNGCSGKSVITAFALGCEVAAKLMAVGGQDRSHESGSVPMRQDNPTQSGPVPSGAQGKEGNEEVDPVLSVGGHLRWRWQVDGIAGTMGATAAAGKLLGLEQEQLENAFGLASADAAGSPVNLRTAAESLQCGRAAMNGVIAAMLAQEGLIGPPDAIEAPGGLLGRYTPLGKEAVIRFPNPEAESRKPDLGEDAYVPSLGNSYEIVYPGVVLKVYPCETAAHTSIDAAIQLMQQYRVDPGQVTSVRVSITPEMASLLPYSSPLTGRQARVSLNYIVAVALLVGQPLIDHFTDAAVEDPRLRALTSRVAVDATESPSMLHDLPSTVTLTLTDGRVMRHRVEIARGYPALPLSAEELNAKFLYCTRYILPPDHIEAAIDQFRNLEQIENITVLASILGG